MATNLPVEIYVQKYRQTTRRDVTCNMPEDIFNLFGLKDNGLDLLDIIDSHQWHHYIYLLNGLTYSKLVKYF